MILVLSQSAMLRRRTAAPTHLTRHLSGWRGYRGDNLGRLLGDLCWDASIGFGIHILL